MNIFNLNKKKGKKLSFLFNPQDTEVVVEPIDSPTYHINEENRENEEVEELTVEIDEDEEQFTLDLDTIKSDASILELELDVGSMFGEETDLDVNVFNEEEISEIQSKNQEAGIKSTEEVEEKKKALQTGERIKFAQKKNAEVNGVQKPESSGWRPLHSKPTKKWNFMSKTALQNKEPDEGKLGSKWFETKPKPARRIIRLKKKNSDQTKMKTEKNDQKKIFYDKDDAISKHSNVDTTNSKKTSIFSKSKISRIKKEEPSKEEIEIKKIKKKEHSNAENNWENLSSDAVKSRKKNLTSNTVKFDSMGSSGNISPEIMITDTSDFVKSSFNSNYKKKASSFAIKSSFEKDKIDKISEKHQPFIQKRKLAAFKAKKKEKEKDLEARSINIGEFETISTQTQVGPEMKSIEVGTDQFEENIIDPAVENSSQNKEPHLVQISMDNVNRIVKVNQDEEIFVTVLLDEDDILLNNSEKDNPITPIENEYFVKGKAEKEIQSGGLESSDEIVLKLERYQQAGQISSKDGEEHEKSDQDLLEKETSSLNITPTKEKGVQVNEKPIGVETSKRAMISQKNNSNETGIKNNNAKLTKKSMSSIIKKNLNGEKGQLNSTSPLEKTKSNWINSNNEDDKIKNEDNSVEESIRPIIANKDKLFEKKHCHYETLKIKKEHRANNFSKVYFEENTDHSFSDEDTDSLIEVRDETDSEDDAIRMFISQELRREKAK